MRSATALALIARARIPIGPDGRNRPSLFPFATATSRNAQAKSLYNAHASMRSFMKFSPDKIGLYLELANAGGRDCSGGAAAMEQSAADYLGGRHLSRLGKNAGQEINQDAKQLEGNAGRQVPAPAHEGAAIGRQLRHGRR